jgi:hypothetical protein
MVERLKITPNEFVVKKENGEISFAAGKTDSGIEHPAYIRNMIYSEVYNNANSNQIYYNQIAPAPYPVDCLNVPLTSMPSCGGAIHAIVPTSGVAGALSVPAAIDAGVYCMVPTMFSGSASDFLSNPVSNISTHYYGFTFMGVSVYMVYITFLFGGAGWFGPWSPSTGRLVYVAVDSPYFSNSNYTSSNITLNSNYSTTEAQTAYATVQTLELYQQLGFGSGPPGIVKILFYARGTATLRFTKK